MATPQEEEKKKVEQAPAQAAETTTPAGSDPNIKPSPKELSRMTEEDGGTGVAYNSSPTPVTAQPDSWTDGKGNVRDLPGVVSQQLSNGNVLMAPSKHIPSPVSGEDMGTTTAVAEENDKDLTGIDSNVAKTRFESKVTKTPAADAVPKVEQKMSYAQLYDYLNPEETEEEKQRKERRAYIRSGLAALGDGISALANIWGTANGAVNTSDGSGLSARASALLAKEREARETREEKRRAGLMAAKKADDEARAKAESDRLDREYKQKVLENTIENTKSQIETRTYNNRVKAEEAILKRHQAEYYVRKTAWVDAISASQVHKNNMAGKGGGSGTNKVIETQKYKAGWISEFSDLDLPMDYLKDTTNGSVEEKLSAAEIESLVKYVYDKGALPAWYTNRMIKTYSNWKVPDVRRFKRGNSQVQAKPSGTKPSSSTQPTNGQLDTSVMGGFSIPPKYRNKK